MLLSAITFVSRQRPNAHTTTHIDQTDRRKVDWNWYDYHIKGDGRVNGIKSKSERDGHKAKMRNGELELNVKSSAATRLPNCNRVRGEQTAQTCLWSTCMRYMSAQWAHNRRCGVACTFFRYSLCSSCVRAPVCVRIIYEQPNGLNGMCVALHSDRSVSVCMCASAHRETTSDRSFTILFHTLHESHLRRPLQEKHIFFITLMLETQINISHSHTYGTNKNTTRERKKKQKY